MYTYTYIYLLKPRPSPSDRWTLRHTGTPAPFFGKELKTFSVYGPGGAGSPRPAGKALTGKRRNFSHRKESSHWKRFSVPPITLEAMTSLPLRAFLRTVLVPLIMAASMMGSLDATLGSADADEEASDLPPCSYSIEMKIYPYHHH
jgi:hypothetical protein